MADASIRIDVSPELRDTLSALAEVLDRLRQVGQRFVGLTDALAQTVRIDLDRLVASRAVDGGVVLEPTDRLLELLAAGRALDLYLRVVEKSHEVPHA